MKEQKNIRKTIKQSSLTLPTAGPGLRQRLSTTIPGDFFLQPARRNQSWAWATILVCGLIFLAVILRIDQPVNQMVLKDKDDFRPTRLVVLQPDAYDPNYFKPTQVISLN
jgi:hypothetical protein